MDIGTAKPSGAERDEVRYHMIDVADPSETFTAGRYQRQARQVVEASSGVPLIVVGGSGLYFRALVDELVFPPHDEGVRRSVEAMTEAARRAELLELDPKAAGHVDLHNPRRVARALEIALLTGDGPSDRPSGMGTYQARYRFRAVGLDAGSRSAGRIEDRLQHMVRAGLVEEVAALTDRLGRTASSAVGYRQLLRVVRGEVGLREGLEQARRATVALARRQRTFFGRDPRISWLPWSDDPEARVLAAREALLPVLR